MPVFEYKATNEEGHPVNGTMLSGSLSQAADELTKLGLRVSSIGSPSGVGDPLVDYVPTSSAENSASSSRESTFQPPSPSNGWPPTETPPSTEPRSKFMTEVVGPLVNKISLTHQIMLFRQLHTMLKAGVPIVQTLDTLAGQTHDLRLKSVVWELKGHAMEGRPISAGLQRYPEMFSPLIVSLMRVGESGGMLENSCKQIADYLDREIELRNLVRRVTIYPKLVLGTSMVVILAANFLMKYLNVKGGLSSPLTDLSTWIILGPILIGLFLFNRVGLANPRIRFNYDQLVLRVPYFGITIQQLCMARFGRAFGALYAGGVAVPEALKLGADACGNEYMRACLHPLFKRLEEGDGIHETLRSSGVFSPIVLDMIHTGETTGNINEMLTKMAEFYEDESKMRSTQSAYAIGVFALVVVGVYVGFIVFQFYSQYASSISVDL